MNLFRSEEHLYRWPLYFQAADDYVMPVADWAEVFSVSMFHKRLDEDYLAHSDGYLEDYRLALAAKGKPVPSPDRILTTVMFTDIARSTQLAATLGDETWRDMLENHNATARNQILHFGGREIKQTGDGFLSSFHSPTRAIHCASAIRNAASELGIEVRAGIHSGECEVIGDDLGGIAVHIGARVTATAAPGQILVTRTVMEGVTGSGIEMTHRGKHQLKGVPGEWDLYAVTATPP